MYCSLTINPLFRNQELMVENLEAQRTALYVDFRSKLLQYPTIISQNTDSCHCRYPRDYCWAMLHQLR